MTDFPSVCWPGKHSRSRKTKEAHRGSMKEQDIFMAGLTLSKTLENIYLLNIT